MENPEETSSCLPLFEPSAARQWSIFEVTKLRIYDFAAVESSPNPTPNANPNTVG